MVKKLNELEAGFVLGRYELVLRIASGGMGEVWAARLKGTRGFQKVVALKFLLPEMSANPSFEQMFLDEAALAAQIRHPNVVQVVDLGEENEILYQVMEWVSGESLWAVMRAAAKKGGVPLEVAARIICQVCAGLHAAHELKDDEGNSIGLVHRDVTPQNILLTPEGLAKVVDFGVAKFAGRGAAETQVGQIKGKVPYMAPEHIRGRELDRRADVFSLGILFYQLIAGVHPFLGDNDQLTMVRISSPTPAVPLRARVPAVSEALSNVVAATLEKSPEKRTKTALDLMHDIERVVPGSSMASSNDLVATFLRGIVGEQIEAREAELREALKDLDSRASMLPPEPGKRGSQASLPPARDEVPAASAAPAAPAQGGASENAPADMPASGAPSGLAGTVLTEVEPAPQPNWARRHSRAVVAAAAIGVVTLIILASSGSPPPPSPGAGETVAVPSPSAAPEPVRTEPAPAEKPATETSAKAAEPSPTPSASPAAGGSVAATAKPAEAVPGSTAAAPRPQAAPTGKAGPKKREYTPGGL